MSGMSIVMSEAPSLIGRPPKSRFMVSAIGSSGARFARWPCARAGHGRHAATAAPSAARPSHARRVSVEVMAPRMPSIASLSTLHSIRYAEASGLNARGSQSGRRSPPGPGAGRAMASHLR